MSDVKFRATVKHDGAEVGDLPWLEEFWAVRYGDYSALQDRIEELEVKLAKVVELLEAWINVATHCTIEDGVCCCGDNMDTHASPMDCGHSPVDHGAYVAMGLADETNTTLAELKGKNDD